MVKTVTLGYRWEGLALHQWAFTHTDLLAIALPINRKDENLIGDWAYQHGIKLLYQNGQDSEEFVGQLRQLNPDIILCHCYTYRLSVDILNVPRLGCINIHPGKLPEYRGRKPIEDALNKGDSELWACLHYMDENFDTGKVIVQVPVPRQSELRIMRSELTKVGLQLLEKKWKEITR